MLLSKSRVDVSNLDIERGIRLKRKKIMYFRIEKDLTQEAMAEMLGVTSQYISYIERGRSNGSYKFWDKFKQVFGIPDEEIESFKKLSN